MWYGKPPIHCDLLNAVAFGVIGDLLRVSCFFDWGLLMAMLVQGTLARTALIEVCLSKSGNKSL